MAGHVSIIGGGPAGLIAAEVLATAGHLVTVHEHMPSVGRKLLLAGRSGLNLTHAEPLSELLERYGDAAAVRAAVRDFPPAALREWAHGLGDDTFVGSTGRVFPRAGRATPLLRAWLQRLRDLGVRMEVGQRWLGWGAPPSVNRFLLTDGTTAERHADATILALGGASWPRVGSDGGWVAVLRGAGVVVHDLRPANCGVLIDWSPTFRDRFAGQPLKNVTITACGARARGDATISATGLESGPVYPLSAAIRDEVQRSGACALTVDLLPDLSSQAVADRLSRRRQKESTSTWLRRTLSLQPAAVNLLREATGAALPNDPADVARLLHAVPLRVSGVAPIARAISSAGGVSLSEVDDQWMLRSRPGVFVAGEMLDWEAPTGGYLLQAVFSTGVAAARGADAWLRRDRDSTGISRS